MKTTVVVATAPAVENKLSFTTPLNSAVTVAGFLMTHNYKMRRFSSLSSLAQICRCSSSSSSRHHLRHPEYEYCGHLSCNSSTDRASSSPLSHLTVANGIVSACGEVSVWGCLTRSCASLLGSGLMKVRSGSSCAATSCQGVRVRPALQDVVVAQLYDRSRQFGFLQAFCDYRESRLGAFVEA